MDDVKTRLKAFDADVEHGLRTCAEDAATKLAAKYDVMEAYAKAAIPASFIRTGISLWLAGSECTEEEIERLYRHVCYMMNGLSESVSYRKIANQEEE